MVSGVESQLPRVDGAPARLQPPSWMAPDVAEIFRQVVASVAADHFTMADFPLIEQYAEAIRLCQDAGEQLREQGSVVNGKTSPWLTVQEKGVRAMVALSARLRLSPQHRFDRLKAGTNARDTGSGGISALQAAGLLGGDDD